MDQALSGKNGNVGMGLIRGGQYGKRMGRKKKSAAMTFSTLEFELDREMQEVFAALEGKDGTVPSEGVQEIREFRQWPWRVIARRFREAQQAGVPASQLFDVVHVLGTYVSKLYTPDRIRSA